jgi:hypothetical protein
MVSDPAGGFGIAAGRLTRSVKTYDAFKGTGSYFHRLQAGYNYMLPSNVVMGIEKKRIWQ